jgi:hypothetical protein
MGCLGLVEAFFNSPVPPIVMKDHSETEMLKKLLHYVIMGYMMSPENQGVFQLMK